VRRVRLDRERERVVLDRSEEVALAFAAEAAVVRRLPESGVAAERRIVVGDRLFVAGELEPEEAAVLEGGR